MSAYLTEPWHDFFVAEVGASAALTGLLFVAASINLEHILSYEGLPERAAETLVVLVNVLIVASFGLVPDQRIALLGWEILVTSGLVWAGVVAAKLRAPAPEPQWRRGYYINAASAQVAVILFLVCGVSLIVGSGGGLYWLAPAVVCSFAVAVSNAWVLMVEIRR